MQKSHSPQVVVRDERWDVIETESFDRVALLTLRGIGADNLGEIARVMTPFDRVHTGQQHTRIKRATRDSTMRAAAAAIVATRTWNECWTAADAQIDIRAWQLEPARAAVSGASRILLADEVGLGKTIQALLIASELGARGLASRMLVLTPASLREQWAAEMSERFGLTAVIFDQVTLGAMRGRLPAGVNPWNTAPVIVSSIDLVKRPEVRAALDAARFDLLIVDEAHHLTPGSDRAVVTAELARRTPAVVLVTATPHSGDAASYRFLQTIGDVGADDSWQVYRRRAADVLASSGRRTRIVAVLPTAAERALLDATLEYAGAVWRSGGAGARLVASVIARRAASSAEAARLTLSRRLSLLRGDESAEPQPLLPWDEDAGDDAAEPDSVIAAVAFADRPTEISWLRRLVELATTAAAISSKLTVLRRLLRRCHEQVIVFSEYRDVAQWVAAELGGFVAVDVLHGGLTGAARRDVIRRFNHGGVRALIATDAAGEGLNLQSRCRLVVTLELPWNPLRLEQRIGRVDRIGQTRRVHARHLVHRDSYEDRVLARLEQRRSRATAELAELTTPVTEETIAAAVFEGHELGGDVARAIHEPRTSPTPSRVEVERRLAALARSPGSGIAAVTRYATSPPRRIAAARIVLVFAIEIHDGMMRVVERVMLPLSVRPDAGEPPRRLTKARVVALAAQHDVESVLRNEIVARLAETRARVMTSAIAFEKRSTALVDALHQHREPPVQASLFDRRAEQQSHAREAVLALWREGLERRLAAASALKSLTATAPRLIAAWLEK